MSCGKKSKMRYRKEKEIKIKNTKTNLDKEYKNV